MLNKHNVTAAKRLVAALEDHAIVPLDNSPVARLAATSVPVAAAAPADVAEAVHQASMTEDLTGSVPHDLVSEETVVALAEATREHFRFARNVVKTAINTVVSAVEDAESSAGMPNYSIVSVRPAEALLSPMLDDLVERFANQVIEPFTLPKGLPDFDDPKIIEMVKTGTPEFDRLLADLIAGHDAGWVSRLWNKFFQEGRAWEPTHNLMAADAYLVVHLLAGALMDNPPEMVGYSLEEYQFVMASTLAATGRTLCEILNTYQGYEDAGVVVLEYPARLPFLTQVEDGEIKVYGPSYDQFLRDNGTPEVIFGACIQDRPMMAKDLLSKVEQYTQAYLTGYDVAMDRFNRERNARLWSLIGSEASRWVTQCDPNVLNPNLADPVGDTQELIKQFVIEFGVVDVTGSYYNWVRDLFGQKVFGHTDALEILKGIDARIAADPSKTPMQAAYDVAVRRIAEHLVCQNKIIK